MGVCEAQSLFGEPVDIGCFDPAVIAANIAITEVVGINKQDIGRCGGL